MSNITPELRQSIIQTLCYFDLFGFPLTAPELYRYLWRPPAVTYAQFLAALGRPEEMGIATRQGYYFLPGRESAIVQRHAYVVPSDQLLYRARRSARLVVWLPFVRAVFVANSVGRETATAHSDIDWLVIAAPRRIWLVRALTNIVLRLLRRRVYGAKAPGKICLCFYLDTGHLDVGAQRAADDDIHFAYWLFQMMPLYDPGNWYGQMLARNAWAHELLPHARPKFRTVAAMVPGTLGALIKKWGEKILSGAGGEWCEKMSRAMQWRYLRPQLKAKAEEGTTDVVVGDGILKLHERDTRRAWRERWLARVGTA